MKLSTNVSVSKPNVVKGGVKIKQKLEMSDCIVQAFENKKVHRM